MQTQKKLTRTWCKPKNPSSINDANLVHTCFVQVPLQLHRRLHLHVVLEEAAAAGGLVVGLQVPSRGLSDGRLHPGLRHGFSESVGVTGTVTGTVVAQIEGVQVEPLDFPGLPVQQRASLTAEHKRCKPTANL